VHPEDATIGDIRKRFVECAAEIPCTNSLQRRPRTREAEPEDVAEARIHLAQQTDPIGKHRAVRILYRRKRRWLKKVAADRFARAAVCAPREGATSTKRVDWMFDHEGRPSHDRRDWGVSVPDHFQALFISKTETPGTKEARLKSMEHQCSLDHSSHTRVDTS